MLCFKQQRPVSFTSSLALFSFLLFQLLVSVNLVQGAEQASTTKSPGLLVVPGPEGHLSIGLQERISSEPRRIIFEQLKNWAFSVEAPLEKPPEGISRLHLQNVQLNGFMFPLQDGDSIKAFLLMATTQTCCYGPRPEFNQFALVEMTDPVAFVRLKPVQITGRFFVEPRPEDGYVFRIEGHSSLPLSEAEIQRAGSVSANLLPEFSWIDFAFLGQTAQSQSLETFSLPSSWSRRIGEQVSVTGNLVIESIGDPHGRLFIASQAWDGCCLGSPPSAFDSLPLTFASDVQVPSPWFKSGKLEGTLVATPAGKGGEKRFLELVEVRPVNLSENYLGGYFARKLSPALHQAVLNEDAPGLRLLLRGGTSPNQRDAQGNTPLHFCALPSRLYLARLLLSEGGDASARNLDHRTPLHEAAALGNATYGRLLLEHKANINATDSFGFTPAAWAVANDREEVTRWLVSNGADFKILNRDGRSLLWLAAQHGMDQLVQTLIDAGLDVNQADKKGKTPLAAARENGHQTTTKLLETLGRR